MYRVDLVLQGHDRMCARPPRADDAPERVRVPTQRAPRTPGRLTPKSTRAEGETADLAAFEPHAWSGGGLANVPEGPDVFGVTCLGKRMKRPPVAVQSGGDPICNSPVTSLSHAGSILAVDKG
jgi:hypothetical protein